MVGKDNYEGEWDTATKKSVVLARPDWWRPWARPERRDHRGRSREAYGT